MKKAYRVKTEQDFQRVFHQGKSMANRQLVVYILPKAGQAHFRVGFSVGKKIGKAVIRNKVKRQLRHAVYEWRDGIDAEWDFILIARPDILTKSYQEIKHSVAHVLQLAGILTK